MAGCCPPWPPRPAPRRNAKGDFIITFTSPDLNTVPSDQLVVQLTVVSHLSTIALVPGSNGVSNGSMEIYINVPVNSLGGSPPQYNLRSDDDFIFIVYKP